jgi:hypothetical protein
MMGHLFDKVGANNYSPLQAVAQDFYEYYDNQTGLLRSATVSVIKTAGLEALATIFHEIAGQARNDNTVQDLQTFGYGNQKIYFDLGDYVQQLSPERYAAFQAALDSCVLYKANTPSYYSAGVGTLKVIRTFSGLSVYIPQAAYPEANEAYERLKWAIKGAARRIHAGA